MVSSTVYGVEDELDRIYSLLTGFGYEVWMSHMGTMPVFSDKSAFENCLEGVRNCDIFLGIIGCQYGSGVDPDDPDSPSILHQEIRLAVELPIPRWLLVHENVLTARTLFRKIGCSDSASRRKLKMKPSNVLSDVRLIDMYEEAILASGPLEQRRPFKERKGNWVQKYNRPDQSDRFLMFQFYRYQEVQAYIEEHFKEGSPFSVEGGDA